MSSHPTAKKTNRRELSNESNTLDLNNGTVTSLMGLSNNQISSNYVLSNNIVLRLIFKLFDICPLIIMFNIVLILALPKSEAYPIWIYCAEFVLILLVHVFKEWHFDQKRRKADQKINKRRLMSQSKVYRNGKQLVGKQPGGKQTGSICWGEINQGDVIYLQKGDTAPADMIVLDTQCIQDREAVVYVNTRSITGKIKVQRKKACYLTQVNTRSANKRNWKKYSKQYLTGKLKYQSANSNTEEFLGYLKLVKDPKTIQISYENFILRQSIIKTCWIYGLVVNSGMQCKVLKSISQKNKNNRKSSNIIDKIFQTALAINIMMGLPFTFLNMFNSGFSSIQNLGYHIMIFSLLQPTFLYIGLESLMLSFSKCEDFQAQITNFSNLINLGSIDYALISYNGVLSSEKMVVQEIVTASSLYDFKESVNQVRKKKNSRRNGVSITESSGSAISLTRENRVFGSITNSKSNEFISKAFANSNRNQRQNSSYFQIEDDCKKETITRFYPEQGKNKMHIHLQPLRINMKKLQVNIKNEQEQSLEMIKAFALCHQAYLKSRHPKFQANSRVYSEQILLQLVNNVGLYLQTQIDVKSKKQLGIRIKRYQNESKQRKQNSKQYYFPRKINRFDNKKIFSVIVRKQGNEDRILYCKGSPQDLLQKIKDKQLKKHIIQNKLAEFKGSKSQIIIYAKKTMSNAEYETYDAEYTKLKMIQSVTQKDLDEFSNKFQKDLQFVCMVGLSSVKNQEAQESIQYLEQKGIKMCLFANQSAEVQTLKGLLRSEKENIQYVDFSGIISQEFVYNINSIIRKLNSQKDYNFSIILEKQSWMLIKDNSSLTQHFLFIAYYADNILTYGFSSSDKAQIAQKLKNNHIKHLSVLSIGSSYSDLPFLNESDVSIITSSCGGQNLHSDIPCEIKMSSISNLRSIIQFGSEANKVYNNLIEVSIYRSALVGTIALVIQSFIYYYERTSYNFNGILAFLYIIVYGIIQTIFLLKLQSKKKKSQRKSIEKKKPCIDFLTNILQGLIHGASITLIVMTTLPNARLQGGQIFARQALHLSIYLLMILVSVARHIIKGEYSIKALISLLLASIILLFGLLWLGSLFSKTSQRLANQIVFIASCYDSSMIIINTLMFCLACTKFIFEERKNNMIKNIFQHYTTKKSSRIPKNSKSIMNKDNDYIQLVKNLFKQEEDIYESINELVGSEFDTNEFRMTSFLQLKKTEHEIKHEFINSQLNLQRFKITMIICLVLLISQLTQSCINRLGYVKQIAFFALGIIIIVTLYIFLARSENIGRNYYITAESFFYATCVFFILNMFLSLKQSSSFLCLCLVYSISTQQIGIRIFCILLGQVVCFISWLIFSLLYKTKLQLIIELIFILSCAVINFSILYKSILDSKRNFILRQQIQMQTNQTNDIWTILVPEFVRNFFAQSGQEGGQYKEDEVAILFCYVCNFDSIIQEEEKNVVRILDDLYRQFDKLCSTYAVQKIETVGYTYMAATGIQKIQNQMESQMKEKNKVDRLVDMAQQMLQKTKLFKWGLKKNKDLDIKIGIHVGPVVVGVIGKHKKQFSLIGTNVNTTSRHGSTGGNRSICLSRQAVAGAQKYKEEYNPNAFVKKQVYMKGLCRTQIDTIPVYLLKLQQACKRTSKSNRYRAKFKQLVMKVIRSNRLVDDLSSVTSQNENTQKQEQKDDQISQDLVEVRQNRRRTTCQGLQKNFNKLQQMKNSKDQMKCYSKLLQFDKNQARRQFYACYPRKPQEQILNMISKQEELHKQYLMDLQKYKGKRDKLLLLSLFILNILIFIADLTYFREDYKTTMIILRVIGIILTIVLGWFSSYFGKYSFTIYLFNAVFIYSLAIEKTSLLKHQCQHYSPLSHFYIMMILTIYSGIKSIRFFNVSILGIIAILTNIIITFSLKGLHNMNPIYQGIYIVFIIVRKYANQRESIINFRQRKQTAHISNQLSKIVSELLPKHAYQKLKTQNFENRLELTDLFDQCTILFADIKGFTEFSDRPENKNQPANVVKMLRSLFEQFDVLCTEKKVYKVYTIGDCYVVLGFTNCYDRNPVKQAQNVVGFAFDMIRKIQQVKRAQPHLSCLNMRIGIHTGTIIGGIVGTQIVRYDIYGSDVVVANKFEQTGKVGQVHISQQTKKLLDQLEKKPYSENNVYQSQKVQIKKLNISYNGYFIKLGNLS